MDQDSTKPGPGDVKGSWRDRLGINKELPKISEEFKEPPQKASPPDRLEPASDKAAAPPRTGAPVARPAPMAPRASAAELGDRLRKQREAAERMAEQRVAEAKERALSEQRAPRPASPQPSTPRPRFTFADDELRQPKPATAVPREAPSRQWSPAQGGAIPSRPVFTADRQNDPRLRGAPPRQAGSAMTPSYARSQSGAPGQRAAPPLPPASPPPGSPERQWQQRSARQNPPLAYDPYRRDVSGEAARQIDDPYAQDDPYRRQRHDMPRPLKDFRNAHSRELDDVEEEPDDLFEDEQSYSAQSRRRATPQDYAHAYREFETVNEQQETRRRTGPFLLIAALLAVGAIAGGLIYFYQKSAIGAQAVGEENVPVVAEPSEPVKTDPEQAGAAEDSVAAPQQQSMAPSPELQAPASQGSQTKQIYDRILGETTLEEQEQIVPSEEQPVAPDAPAQGFDTDPLPLPLPPPPGGSGEDQSGSLEQPDPSQTSAASTKSAAENFSQQASPAAASFDNDAAPAADNSQSAPVEPSEPSSVAAISKPEPEKAVSAAQKIENELAFAEQPTSSMTAAGGSGPVQIVQLPGSDAPSASTSFAAAPQSLPDRATSSPVRVKRRASDKVVSSASRNFNKSRPVEVAQIEPVPLTTQSFTEAATESAREPPSEPEAAPQRQAALPAAQGVQTQSAHATGSGFIIQLASYKSEADALGGYEQLRQQHGTIIGSLSPNIEKTDLGANGTFYRLHLGSFSSRQAAKDACKSLLAAGERDCLVKAR
jgi:cell division septation protein DedD